MALDEKVAIVEADDEFIVLPWWQNPVNIIVMVLTAAILAAMSGWMAADSERLARHNAVDTGFLQDMRDHHDQAIAMGLIYSELPDINRGLDIVAISIVRGQSLEVGRMVQLLRGFGETEVNEGTTSMTWMGHSFPVGEMPGMASDSQIEELGRASGRHADELFVELMTAHHKAGAEMASFAAQQGESSEVIRMATAMASSQLAEIDEMADQLD